MSAADDIAQYFDAQGIGTFAGASSWSVNVAVEPDSPDETVTVYDTGGSMSEPDSGVYHPEIQVRARSHNYLSAHSKLVEARSLLIDSTDFIANGVRYTGAWVAIDISSIGRDESNRHRLVMTLALMQES